MNRNRRLTRLRRLALAGAAAGVLGVAAAPTTASGDPDDLDQRRHRLVSARVAARRRSTSSCKPHTVKFKIAQGGAQIGINDVAASRVSIGDVSRDPLPTDPAGPGLLPDRQVRDLRGHEQSQHAVATSPRRRSSRSSPARPAPGARSPARRASGTIDLISRTSVAGVLTSFQTLLLEGKKVSSRSPPNSPPRVCCARRSKTIRTGSASCPTTRRRWARSTRSATTAWPATSRP